MRLVVTHAQRCDSTHLPSRVEAEEDEEVVVEEVVEMEGEVGVGR